MSNLKSVIMNDNNYDNKEIVNHYLEVNNWNYAKQRRYALNHGFSKDLNFFDITLTTESVTFWQKLQDTKVVSRLAIISINV